MWYGQISLANIITLENIFATLTPNGWVIPDWLKWLRIEVEIDLAYKTLQS